MGMSELDLEAVIRGFREAIDGEVCSRSRVVDALLDLRLDGGDRQEIVALVDHALATVPGNTMVAADWWRGQLDLFGLVALNQAEPVG